MSKPKQKLFIVAWELTGNTEIEASSAREAKEKFENPDGPYHYKIWSSTKKVKGTSVQELEVDEVREE